jgi:hypothetical protein
VKVLWDEAIFDLSDVTALKAALSLDFGALEETTR